jgi:Lon protease-like protein
MVADATLAGQCMGMVLLKDGWEQDYYGNPPIFETGCVGRLISVHPLPGGRSNILLQGLHRFDIQEQFYDKSYREARIVLKPAHATDTLDPRVRAELIRLVREYMRTRDDGGVWHELSRPDVTDEVLVNNLSASLDVTPLEKQFLLEAESLPGRVCRLNELIQFKLCERHGARGSG